MLSEIENGTARPSMDTLRYLAGRLGKPISYFLEEAPLTSPNQILMAKVRQAYQTEDFSAALRLLEDFHSPDDAFEWERQLLIALSCLALADLRIAQDKQPHARELLLQAESAGKLTPYYTYGMDRQRLLLLGQLGDFSLPNDDRELLLRAQNALAQKNPIRASAYLEAAEDHTATHWLYLQGQAWLAQNDFFQAKECFVLAYNDFPRECCKFLEQCCRELEDFKEAYHYACMLRELER
jgi:transcriptional regulator with XRE-family HTH domain